MAKQALIEPDHPSIPVSRQCRLLGISRSGYYYQPHGESQENIRLMHRIDEIFTKYPFYGVKKMTAHLRRQGHPVNVKRIRRLMRKMGLEAIYPKPKLSRLNPAHHVYPYLLEGLEVTRPNQVWCTDITYIRLKSGFVYLVAVMDWFSRYVLSWELSVSLDTAFCLSALDRALEQAHPEIFNSDQGSQFTSQAFTDRLLSAGVAISMDGRGRVFDNIFIERLWRTLKYDKVYLNDWQQVREAEAGIDEYFLFYNLERPHQSLNDATPAEVHYNGV